MRARARVSQSPRAARRRLSPAAVASADLMSTYHLCRSSATGPEDCLYVSRCPGPPLPQRLHISMHRQEGMDGEVAEDDDLIEEESPHVDWTVGEVLRHRIVLPLDPILM